MCFAQRKISNNSCLLPMAYCQLLIAYCQLKLIFVPMIAFLRGDFIQKNPASVVVDVNGVGYDVQISLNTFSKIQHLDKGLLYTSLLIREDAHILYGFFDLT